MRFENADFGDFSTGQFKAVCCYCALALLLLWLWLLWLFHWLSTFFPVLAMYNDYVTVEPYVRGTVADVRVQQIGDNIRAYRRVNRATWKVIKR